MNSIIVTLIPQPLLLQLRTEDESDSMLCNDLKCNLGEEYLLDPKTDVMDDPLDLLDY